MDQTGRTRAASVARVLCFGVLMTVLVAAELYLHYKTIPVFLDYLREAEHKNSAWIGGQISFMLPFLTIAFFQYTVYCRAERGRAEPGIVCPAERLYQREKTIGRGACVRRPASVLHPSEQPAVCGCIGRGCADGNCPPADERQC